MLADAIKIFLPALVAFFLGMGLTPILTHYLYKHQMWKKKAGKMALDGAETPIFNSLHKEQEVGTPKMGGVIIWGSVVLTVFIFWILKFIFPEKFFEEMNFLSRGQTWLPLFTIVVGSLIGLVDDFFEVRGNGDHVAGGLSLKKRLIVVFLVGCVGAWWFYTKLGITLLSIPFAGTINLGLLFVPFFIAVMLAIYASGVIDGLDGLAGGVFTSIFFSFSVIAFAQDQMDLAAFSASIAGATLAFLWYNIPPARFYMSETGTMGLTLTLAVIAFLTDAHAEGRGVLILPILAFPLFITLLSVILQLLSKKFRNGKKIFLIAPLHHHFEAKGWPAYKVTMRYWVISAVAAILGVVLSLFGE